MSRGKHSNRFLVCPQCGISNLFVILHNNQVNIKINWEKEVVMTVPDTNPDSIDLQNIHCLGCSWEGSVNKLVKYFIG
ncbi:MAG: hypothetical protein C0594_02675 [Marinilabiliales bacterium]|nr:MAG: hypothetical protein C0594_02675 [Marinilabiliales bacterium]